VNGTGKQTLAYYDMTTMEQHTKNVNIYMNNNTYSCLETSGGQSSDLYLNIVYLLI
jgi:hypothetical protein